MKFWRASDKNKGAIKTTKDPDQMDGEKVILQKTQLTKMNHQNEATMKRWFNKETFNIFQ